MTEPLQYSIFFFAASSDDAATNRYRLLLESTQWADQHNFTAVWIPERHFAAFGGLYPNPSVLAAAVAVLTKRIAIRAGSVVSPLQDPLRVAEEWSVVDNLSNGRVGLSFASGWHVNDFVLAPDKYEKRGQVMREQIEIVKKLWRGESIKLRNGAGNEIDVSVLPRAVQREPAVWLTAQSDATFTNAGELGFNVLTNFNYKKRSDLERKIGLYREAMQKHHGRRGHFTLMAHTFVAENEAALHAKARPALVKFLTTNVAMQEQLLQGLGVNSLQMTEDDRAFLINHAVQQFITESGFIMTADACVERAQLLHAAGVDELACLIDFGASCDDVLESLQLLAKRVGLL